MCRIEPQGFAHVRNSLCAVTLHEMDQTAVVMHTRLAGGQSDRLIEIL
jgi:hypothetical protein